MLVERESIKTGGSGAVPPTQVPHFLGLEPRQLTPLGLHTRHKNSGLVQAGLLPRQFSPRLQQSMPYVCSFLLKNVALHFGQQ